MRGASRFSGLIRLVRTNWLGPHFYYDLIRLARKGWPTFVRVLYLVVLLLSLTVMYRTQGSSVRFQDPGEFARRAQSYATTLIVLQNILILALLPVYVASTIAEEKENQTLEALTLTQLTDRELVLGKLGSRLMHLGAIVLSSFPLLAFMHLWGNVDVVFLAYHEINTLLLLASAGSVCIYISTRSESVFQAVSNSYIALVFFGILVLIAVFVLPEIFGMFFRFALPLLRDPTIPYVLALLIMTVGHVAVTLFGVIASIGSMEYLRLQEQRRPRKTTTAMALTDGGSDKIVPGKRGEVRSRIHPWAWPVHDDALFWKECIKDGTRWSLSVRWLAAALVIVLVMAVAFRVLDASLAAVMDHTSRTSFSARENRIALRGMAYSFCFTGYLVALGAYALVVLFQMTMSVAGEREQGTLTFLLMIPTDRRDILFAKWLGSWWRNWPVLAVSYFSVLLGLACGLYGIGTALLLLVLFWPLLLMLGSVALWLSVVCRRVLFANICLVGFLGALLIIHVVMGEQTRIVLSLYLAIISELALTDVLRDIPWEQASALAIAEQGVFLLIAGLCAWQSFRMFRSRDYASNG